MSLYQCLGDFRGIGEKSSRSTKKVRALQKLLSENINLPSPPAIAVRILDAVREEETSFKELAAIISSDPALTAKILTIANSSFYSLPKKVDSIERALSVLGANTLKNIALSFVIAKGIRGDGTGFDFELFWKRAITGAVGADLIAKKLRRRNDDIFVAGLLQDIGMVILSLTRTNDYLKVLDEREVTEASLVSIETAAFGFDHQELGAEILKKWGLPESIYHPIQYHHAAGNGLPEEIRTEAKLLFLADKVASVYHGSHSTGHLAELKEMLGNVFQMEDEDVESLIDEVAEKSIEILASFEIEVGDMKPYSQILQEANAELGKLNLSYEQLVMEFKQAKERAEKLASELKDANIRLRELAFRDGLTGLFNHRYFQDLMDKEVSRAVRYKRAFSLILFDIDHFKKVNDTYGHPAGDIVLKTLGRELEIIVRKSDVAARYGGEEFVVVLPETDLKGAAILAERLRSLVEFLTIPADGVDLKVTISIGVSCFDPDTSSMSKAEIIEAADKALYRSKHDGRNRVTLA